MRPCALYRPFALLAAVLYCCLSPSIAQELLDLQRAEPTLSATAEEALLHPEEAFQLSVLTDHPHRLTLRWRIAEGYYLYRHRLDFAIAEPAPTKVALAPAELPPGEATRDEFFGEVIIYRQNLTVELPLERDSDQALEFTLRVRSQGCAEVGVCYLPQTQEIPIYLPLLAEAEGAEKAAPMD